MAICRISSHNTVDYSRLATGGTKREVAMATDDPGWGGCPAGRRGLASACARDVVCASRAGPAVVKGEYAFQPLPEKCSEGS